MKRMDAWLTTCLIGCLTMLTAMATAPAALAQGTATKPGGVAKPIGKKINPLDVKRLDAKLDEVRESFLRDTTNLILSYENLGQYERAKTLLESLQKLDPRNEPIKAKLGELNAKIIENNEFDVEIDTDESWQPIGAVTKDRLLRIRVTGDYNLTLSQTSLGPEGLPTANPAEDLVANVPLGAVMGVITPAGSAGTFAGGNNDKQPRPFAVGASYEKPADRDGILHLKVNVPPGTRCTGKLKVKISGPDRPGS
jgi:hypothetical protein